MPALLHSPYAIQKPPAGSQVDWGHPLTRGLVGAWFCLDPGNMMSFDSGPMALHGVLTSVTHVTTEKNNPSWHFNGSSSLISVANARLPNIPFNSQPGTWLVSFRTTSTARQSIVFRGSSGSSRPSGGIYHDSFANSGPTFAGLDGSGNAIAISEGVMRNDGKWHTLVACWDQSSGKVCNLYRNGALVVSGTTSKSWSFGANDLRLGNSADAFWGKFTGEIDKFLVWNRFLSASDVLWLYTEPYTMLRGPDVWRRYFPIGGPVGVNNAADGATTTRSLTRHGARWQ